MPSGTRGTLAVSILLILVWLLVFANDRHSDASPGARTFDIYCSKCHLPGSREALGSDLQHIMAPGHLRERDVRRIIIDGKNIMRTFGRRLSKKQIEQLIQYLKQL
jgi:mono/diheme cytochrome c family protein